MDNEQTTLAMWKLLITKPNSIADVDAALPSIDVPLTYQTFMLDGPLLLEGSFKQLYNENLAPETTRVDITNVSTSGKISLNRVDEDDTETLFSEEMVTWYENGSIRVGEFGLETSGTYEFSLVFEMFSFVPIEQADSTWETPSF